MIGNYLNQDVCLTELKAKGFSFLNYNGEYMVLKNQKTNDLAEIHIYSDQSISVLYG